MKVLIAEDDQFTRDGLTEVLKEEGYEVKSVSDGESAIEYFKSFEPNFVCLDIMMPKSSGYEVCKAIRAQDPELPIIFISAKSEEVDKLVGFELGADDFIVKPICRPATSSPAHSRSP